MVDGGVCVRQGGGNKDADKDGGPDTSVDTSTDTSTDTSVDTQLPSLGTWVVGDVEPCATPQPVSTYTDSSLSIGDAVAQPANHWGLVMLFEVEGEPVVAYSRGWLLVVARLRDGALISQYEFNTDVGVATVADMDGDGVTDMVLYGGTGLEVVWSVGTQAEERTVYLDYDSDYPAHDVSVADFDSDGKQDILLVFMPLFVPGLSSELKPVLLQGQGGRLFEAQWFPEDPPVWGMGHDVSLIDIDGDGDMDSYLCHDSGPEVNGNLLLENDGSGGLEPATNQRGLDVVTFCMGVSWGDVNADGLMDAYLSTMTQHHLLLRDASGAYYDGAAAAGFPGYFMGEGTMQMGWGTALVDVDNDGRVDLVLGTSDFSAGTPMHYPVWLLLQQEDGTFEDASVSYGLPQQTGVRGLLAQDLNQDGVVDFLVGDMARTPYLLLSDGCTAANWMEVTAPDGTQVTMESAGTKRTALATYDPGFSATGPATVHFGLGETAVVDRITLHLPGGDTVVKEGPLEARRRLVWERVLP